MSFCLVFAMNVDDSWFKWVFKGHIRCTWCAAFRPLYLQVDQFKASSTGSTHIYPAGHLFWFLNNEAGGKQVCWHTEHNWDPQPGCSLINQDRDTTYLAPSACSQSIISNSCLGSSPSKLLPIFGDSNSYLREGYDKGKRERDKWLQ